MKAVFLNATGGPETLVYSDAPEPHAGDGEVLVRVHATAITPTEFDWVPTWKTPAGAPRPFPIILSHEFSGVVEAVGSSVTDIVVGDAVYGLNDWFRNGAQAELCVALATELGPKPHSVDHAHAAAVPISALTAWQGLFARGGLTAGQRVLIHGAAGGVGIFAVQLARWRGAHVTATASARDLASIRTLGADEVVDYQATRFEDVAYDVDLVFDAVGGETLARSWSVLKPSGRLVTIATASEVATEPRVGDAFFIVEANRVQLREIARLLDDGQLRLVVEAVFPLTEASQAYARAGQGGMRVPPFDVDGLSVSDAGPLR
jgi:NADPH:quinone reductase-like Zn-dependent oxidoreductase